MTTYLAFSSLVGLLRAGLYCWEEGPSPRAFLPALGWAALWPASIPFAAFLWRLDRRGRLKL